MLRSKVTIYLYYIFLYNRVHSKYCIPGSRAVPASSWCILSSLLSQLQVGAATVVSPILRGASILLPLRYCIKTNSVNAREHPLYIRSFLLF